MTPEELFRIAESSSDRFERASAAASILRSIGIPDPSVEDVAKIMRWYDGHMTTALEALSAHLEKL